MRILPYLLVCFWSYSPKCMRHILKTLINEPVSPAAYNKSSHFPMFCYINLFYFIFFSQFFFIYFNLFFLFLYILKTAGGRPSGTTGSAQVLPTPPCTTELKLFRSMLSTTHYSKRQNTERSKSKALADKHDFWNDLLSAGLRQSSVIDRVHTGRLSSWTFELLY